MGLFGFFDDDAEFERKSRREAEVHQNAGACPNCYSDKRDVFDTTDVAAAGVLWKARCKKCGHVWDVDWEL